LILGYVQGMTDLVIPFLSAFLRPYLGKEISDVFPLSFKIVIMV
jgi:hypothetical protein